MLTSGRMRASDVANVLTLCIPLPPSLPPTHRSSHPPSHVHLAVTSHCDGGANYQTLEQIILSLGLTSYVQTSLYGCPQK